ncbi:MULTISPECIES: FAD binding domain-containing protein [Pseudomonas]|uniref:Carbon monoxide dehydrogenase n=1 Tax=Pseudomonas putida TaxID=303 RepID=A0AAP9N3X9_PSEPU|nr:MULTISPECIES: FAD binding domain-containing protein [Pseudomonas]MDD2040205.1 FAD binding domain-containing protein [Pseudomonas putida]MDD2045644.1 FAD binding domain-containing protein [Pseudomonas putida]QJQ12293.1 carbon monoxide dehydrogenase [Pseudomonas putida]WOB57740.1 FAD binding domain-containing protein [Pseudomonas sp. NBB]
MRPAVFVYEKANSIAEAIKYLSASGGLAKPIAGGQSLVPMMNLRLARPNALVSLRKLPELLSVVESKTSIHVGAATTHADIEDCKIKDVTCGYLPYVAKGIAYRAIRNRGTVGGSLCHADPAADWLSSLSALGARCHVEGISGKREIPIENFMIAPFVSALGVDEILVSVELPCLSVEARWAYVKFCHKAGEFAKSICAIVVDPSNKIYRIFIGGTDGPPLFLREASSALATEDYTEILNIAQREIRASLPDAQPDSLSFHLTMIERALARLEAFSR